MTKLVLEEGKFYINRKGEKVGPVSKVGEKDSNMEWASGYTNWCADGREYRSWESDFDLIEEWKEESDDEWGPWVVDRRNWVVSTGASIVEYGDDDEYVRHKLKKPVVKKQIEVGKSYVSKNNPTYPWECIYIDEGRGIAWMKKDNGTAYVWTLEGKSISLNTTYDIDFSQDPSDYDRVPF